MISACHFENPALTRPIVATGDELDLIVRARRGDVAAFEQLYRRHVGHVYAVCLRLTADVLRAEEFTQTAFIQVWKKLPLFRGESAFATWLHRLAVNTVLMEFRTARRREERVMGAEDPAALETAPPACPAGLRLDLELAIATLPPRARAVFVLHDIEGYTHEEIATLLDLESGTTKAHLHRARQILQETLR
jgi:RNA polymerase sigma-70 factor (ECF subfamily)